MRLAALMTACLGLLPLPAAATSLSMNEVELAPGTSLEACKAQARAAIAAAGLTAQPEAPASVFGDTESGLIAAIYCLPDRGIAMIAVAWDDNAVTRSTLIALLEAMRAR